MPTINHSINLHWQDNPRCNGLYLYRDKVLPYIVLASVAIIEKPGEPLYYITPFDPKIKPAYSRNRMWFQFFHSLKDLFKQQCQFWGPIDLEWLYENFDCKDVDYRKPLKWSQPKRMPKEETDAVGK